MPNQRFASLGALAFALAVVTGHVTDRTTGQPLTGVRVELSGASTASATTRADGSYRIPKLKPGRYVVTLSSNDVPPQRYDLTIAPTEKSHARDFTACSTTLDYSCRGAF
jgi:protocatechuate 3,4-dioxygenase beta subunit